MPKTALLQPDLILGGTIFNLTPQIIDSYGIKGLILDVDDTIVSFNNREVSEQLQEWISAMKKIVPIWLVSNNISQNRIATIANALDLPYIFSAKKPSRRRLREAAAEMNLPVERVAMIGDRLFTDVLAGNRLGMFTVLVEPIVDPLVPERSHPIRSFEVWLSQILGVSLTKFVK